MWVMHNRIKRIIVFVLIWENSTQKNCSWDRKLILFFFCLSWPYVSFYLVCISGIVGVFHVFNPLQFIIVCRSNITRIFTSISITYILIAQIDECQMSSGIIYWIACWKKICLNLEFIGIFDLKYISCLSQFTSVALIMDCMYTSLEHLFACLSVITRHTETFFILNLLDSPFFLTILTIFLKICIPHACFENIVHKTWELLICLLI